ncbi:MAG TPA: Gfo/Idh/MocA family oxidoreductase, partial [Reyranella sp.]|nr:Gfo/Idh/MocA family oxidoreductase [Reyranella sp.]
MAMRGRYRPGSIRRADLVPSDACAYRQAMNSKLRLGLVGFGKIARDQHSPAIARSDDFELVAAADPITRVDGVRNYPGIEAMLAGEADLDAVVLCQPPQVRCAAARLALEAGKHVFLEKPPGVTVTEAAALKDLAAARGVTLFAAWHSRYAAGVAQAREWIAARRPSAIRIVWKEDVRVWHPGQEWIWRAGGFGVFDPGINALSILTAIVPGQVSVSAAELTFPENCNAPIAARLALATAGG